MHQMSGLGVFLGFGKFATWGFVRASAAKRAQGRHFVHTGWVEVYQMSGLGMFCVLVSQMTRRGTPLLVVWARVPSGARAKKQLQISWDLQLLLCLERVTGLQRPLRGRRPLRAEALRAKR